MDAEGANRIVLGQGLSAESVTISAGSSQGHAGQTQIDFGSGAVFIDANSPGNRIKSADGVAIRADAFDNYRLTSIPGDSGVEESTVTEEPYDTFGSNSKDVIHGDAGHDALRGDAGSDRLSDDSANDTIEDGQAGNSIDGGIGNHKASGRGFSSSTALPMTSHDKLRKSPGKTAHAGSKTESHPPSGRAAGNASRALVAGQPVQPAPQPL
jgi:Ca2+-binding RTX toxin-like protein